MLDPLLRSMVYPAPMVPVPPAPPEPLEAVHLSLADSVGSGGSALAWFQPAPESELKPEDAGPLVLFFHGNGENLETMRWSGTFEEFREVGAAVLAADYPGYGNSPGTPSEDALHATADAALEWAREHHPDRPVVAVGWSLGAALAVGLAARSKSGDGEPLAGLVALSAWTSLPEVAKKHFPAPLVKLALSERYDSLAAVEGLRLPVLLVHGTDDSIIPVTHGRRLAEVLGPTATWVEIEGAGHNDLLARREAWDAIGRFLSTL